MFFTVSALGKQLLVWQHFFFGFQDEDKSHPQSPTEGDGQTEATDAVSDETVQKETDLLSVLSAEDVKSVVKEVFEEMLGGLQVVYHDCCRH